MGSTLPNTIFHIIRAGSVREGSARPEGSVVILHFFFIFRFSFYLAIVIRLVPAATTTTRRADDMSSSFV